ncbi:hypothetical protein FOZ63_006054 [Perkinsus olseni]|uniref:Uncharacterized protein n=1 Tax=Perkinsus olseni TaxID=32597 RepID=A0A7J6UN83_PEROL|nr:hypothetical protein FOZ63_006054 [Perkinsus olseni]
MSTDRHPASCHTDVVRLHWVSEHPDVEGSEIDDQLAAQGGSLSEVNAEGCVSGRTLTRYLKERMAACSWWSDERARLGTAIKVFFFCVSHTSPSIRRQVTAAARAVVLGNPPPTGKRCVDIQFEEFVQ